MDSNKLNQMLAKTREQSFRKKEQWKLDKANSNVARTGTEQWQEVIKNRDYSYFQSEENRQRKSEQKQNQLNDADWKKKFDKKMKEVYSSDLFKNSVNQANKDPVRNSKISKALSIEIKTPDGTFKSIKECSDYYNISTEGVRYRCKTDPNWTQTKSRGNQETKKKLSNSAKATASKRLENIANKKGFIFTPYGKFLSVREAWREEKLYNNSIHNNSHIWFKKISELDPDRYYKK